MRCAIVSRAGQILAYGQLFVRPTDNDELRLDLQTDRGRVIHGGIIGPDGDMSEASQVLFRQFFEVWGMSDLTLKITIH
jgi:hypothetical protein